jgi:L-ascorbate metabolism protein UlaG (beta-lactamase superfamily)
MSPKPRSDHFDGTRFFNPGEQSPDRGFGDMLKWRRTSVAAPWPASLTVEAARPETRVEGLAITMVGHASLLIQAAGLNLLTDPVWSDRASPLPFAGPKRVTAPGIAFDDLPPIDAVLLSHNHYDHLDVSTLRRLHERHDPLFVMPLGNDAIVGKSVPGARMAVADWGDRVALGENHATTLTRANHWSARGIRDRRMALWAGHWLDTPAGSIWFAGDTGYGTGAIFRDIRERHGAPNVALIPIGAYEPRWFMKRQHVDPSEAVQIMQDVEATAALGIHWGTFQLTDEARKAPVAALADALAHAGVPHERFRAAEPGRTYAFHAGS